MIGWCSLYPVVLLYFSYRRRRKYTFWRYSAWRRRSRSSRWDSFFTKVPICETPGTSWTSWSSSLGQYTQLALFWFRAFGVVAPTPGTGGGGARAPHFYKWGDTVSRRTANEKLTKLCWPSRKRSTKTTNYTFRAKNVEGYDRIFFWLLRPDRCPQIRPGAASSTVSVNAMLSLFFCHVLIVQFSSGLGRLFFILVFTHFRQCSEPLRCHCPVRRMRLTYCVFVLAGQKKIDR